MKTILTLLMLIPLATLAEGAKQPKPKPGKPTPAKSEGEAPVPSRLIEGNIESYVAQLRSRMAINGPNREIGPFGLSQDLAKIKQGIIPIATRNKIKKVERTPFADVVRAIPITGVFPLEQEFLVGSRTFATGQVFPVVAAGENIKVRVEGVRSASVLFRNTTSDEVIEKRLDDLPDGVTPGGGSIEVRGLTERRKADLEPLHIKLPRN